MKLLKLKLVELSLTTYHHTLQIINPIELAFSKAKYMIKVNGERNASYKGLRDYFLDCICLSYTD